MYYFLVFSETGKQVTALRCSFILLLGIAAINYEQVHNSNKLIEFVMRSAYLVPIFPKRRMSRIIFVLVLVVSDWRVAFLL